MRKNKKRKRRSLLRSFGIFSLGLFFSAAVAAGMLTADGAGRLTSSGEKPPTAGIFLKDENAAQNFAVPISGEKNPAGNFKNEYFRFLLPAPAGNLIDAAGEIMRFARDISGK